MNLAKGLTNTSRWLELSMAIPNYTPERRREIAALLNVEEQYIYQIGKGLRTASPALARQLNEIDPTARLEDLRPDDYWLIWPDLHSPATKVA